jgi:hypothetical protein
MRTRLKVCVGEFPSDLTSLPDHFVYFLRVTEGMVPLPSNYAEAVNLLPSYFEVSVISGHSLDVLEQLLTLVTSTCYVLFC